MKRVTLLFNPHAGSGKRREVTVQRVADFFNCHDVMAECVATTAAGSAGQQVEAAIQQGADAIIVCGGDGTVLDALQGIAQKSRVALGIIPMGSANVLARHLRMSLDPMKAAEQLLTAESRITGVGLAQFHSDGRARRQYFLSVIGAGPDAMLAYKALSSMKMGMGRVAYYALAAKLFATSRFEEFEVEYTLEDGETVRCKAVEAMAVRVPDLGGVFLPLFRASALEHTHLSLTLVRRPARFALMAWFAMCWLKLDRWNPLSETLRVRSFRCVGSARVQADGTWLGTLPLEVELIAEGVTLLFPRS